MDRKSFSEQLKEYFESEKGKKEIEEYKKHQDFLQSRKDQYLSWFDSIGPEKRAYYIQKVIDKYESKEYKDRWYSRGYFPQENLFWYIFDYAYYAGEIFESEKVLVDVKFPDAYKVDYKCLLNKTSLSSIRALYHHHIKKLLEGEENFAEVFLKLIKDDSKVFAIEKPEGYIFKYRKKIFQIENDKIEVEPQEKSSYEFLLSDFIKFSKIHNYSDKIVASYTKTVCNLFNNYIINGEKINHTIENNIDISGIESPYIGTKFDIGYEYIPDQVTKELCRESELYKNIFKVLLANLRKGKDETHCIFLTKKEVNEWNMIMKSIKIRNLYI